MRKHFFYLAVLILLMGAGLAARGQNFTPDLGEAREIIAGRAIPETAIAADAKELTVYPMPAEYPRQILNMIPGQQFRQVTPMPLARAWWKYPLYAVFGLPRDLFDGFAGGVNEIPFINIPIVMGGYELIPTQFLMRDPRDWHPWPGNDLNALGHGPYKGDSWGWFPSLHSWHFTYPSQTLARRNQLFNEKLKGQIDAENRTIEAQNSAIDARLRDCRSRALEAVKSGNGREAAYRMIPYRHVYPLDEGGFALYVTALALYVSEGPDWIGPELWHDLETAQPRVLIEAEKMLATTAAQFPDKRALGEALIYTRLMLGRTSEAFAAAQSLLKSRPEDPYRQRLVFELALTRRDLNQARAIRAAMSPTAYDAPTRQLMDIRLTLLGGDAATVIGPLAQLQAQAPEDAYAAYYLACAELLAAQKQNNPADEYKKAEEMMNKWARNQAPGLALRTRADSAVAWLQSVLATISTNPQLFTETGK